ncbi:SDR family oxidoreductase [Labedella phragmitis]|uniref:SDR family oxidoreductase n=1 Tax=Labedella phragmitis TaxID=2498849 RepID=A0A3S3Z2A2_9MICO|nr:SDR family oxidoreductase [Labedella phragmitis]RWZ46181.1 SDR family oxidoreductase [Labedella phragmitis]
MPQLDGARVLIVGAGSGIGTAVAHATAEAGAHVIATSRRSETANHVAARIGHGAEGIRLDLSDETTIAEAAQRLGRVDHIVSVAADHANGPLSTLERRAIDEAFTAKVVGPILLTKHFVPTMPTDGSIVLFSGYASVRPAPTLTVMATANGAVDALVPALATEVAPIRVVGISPGVVDSGSWDDMSDKETFFDNIRASNPARRVGTPDDIAAAVVFALTSRFLTATTLRIDGGQPVA